MDQYSWYIKLPDDLQSTRDIHRFSFAMYAFFLIMSTPILCNVSGRDSGDLELYNSWTCFRSLQLLYSIRLPRRASNETANHGTSRHIILTITTTFGSLRIPRFSFDSSLTYSTSDRPHIYCGRFVITRKPSAPSLCGRILSNISSSRVAEISLHHFSSRS